MIGQKNILERIHQQIESDKFPRFSILVGPKGSGKKTLAHSIFKMFGNGIFTVCDITVDAVRNMIAEAHKLNGVQAVYLIPDADTMSVQAKNALLKITEEPPKGAYFIMTLEDENNTLYTIRSRGTSFYMDRYTPSEIAQYAKQVYGEESVLYSDLCETPGDVDMLHTMGIDDFYNYAELTVNNIQKVSLANALKISNRISVKSDDVENYDLKMFWKVFMRICNERIIDDTQYLEWIRITAKELRKLNVRGINKQMLFDNWIFEIREWR